MRVSVIIPTLNPGPLFKEVLEAVRSQEWEGELELVVVDSMSDDGAAELAKKYADVFFQVRREEFNHGQTRNLAISRSRGELIALLVQDATPANPLWLKNLAKNFSDPQVAGAYSRQIPRPDCNPLLRIRLEQWGAGKPNKRVQKLNSSKPLSAYSPQEIISTFSFDNVSSMLRRSVWEKIKFPKRRFAEDIAWAKQVLEKGYKIVFEPESVVIHSHKKSLWYEFKRVYLDHENWWQVGEFRIFNRPREVLGASISGTRKMLSELKRLDLSPAQLLWWGFYTPAFVFSQNLAQYMGGWAERWREKYPGYQRIDRFLSKGV